VAGLSKVQICNQALSRLGSKSTVESIDSPQNKQELTFAKWWDITRRKALKELVPSFALRRRQVAMDAEAPAFGYGARFAYPSDCVKVLGFGEIQDNKNNFSIEGGWILTDDYQDDGYLNLRFVADVTDATTYSPEFTDVLSWYLAEATCLEITQDLEKYVAIEKVLAIKKAEAGGINSQENRPIRINESKFKKARNYYSPTNTDKK